MVSQVDLIEARMYQRCAADAHRCVERNRDMGDLHEVSLWANVSAYWSKRARLLMQIESDEDDR